MSDTANDPGFEQLISKYHAVFDDLLRSVLKEVTTDTITHAPLRGAAIEYLRNIKGPMTVAYVDLDGLKRINDRFGHTVGDKLLMMTVVRLFEAVGPKSFVGRMGGDEFIVVSTTMTEGELYDKLADKNRQKSWVMGHHLTISYSFGVASGTDWEIVLQAADTKEAEDKDRHYLRRTR